MKRRFLAGTILVLFIVTGLWGQQIESPEQVFGFKMGTDRKLINWEQIVSYFERLDAQSERVRLVELGKTTLDRRMIMAVIGSEDVIRNAEAYQKIQRQIGRPFDLEPEEADTLIAQGKLIFLITLNIHSTEIAASQESVELAYELATSEDTRIQKIRDNVIVLLVPSLNPDGQDKVTKWYLKDVGTPYEGSRMPMKYHHYADHDNNRDWFFFNLVESRHVAKVLYHDWYPEIVMDQHQMGSAGARFFLPPYSDPVNPNVPPALMASVNMLGKHVVADMHHQGFTGLVTNTIFNAFFEGTMSKTPLWHNRIGILTEAASVRVASPIFFPKTSLRGMGLDLPEYRQQTNFLDPWPGGWWRLRDIIEYEKAATYSMLDLAATYKDKFKQNFYRLNRDAIAAGEAGNPFAYVIPVEQHDPNNAVEMLRRLRIANVDIYRAEEDFSVPEGNFKKGDFILPLAQASRAYIKDLMELQQYPNLREYPGGPPRQPYDVTAWTLPLLFGATAVEVKTPFAVVMQKVEPQLAFDAAEKRSEWQAVERRFSNSYKLVNELLKSGREVYELTSAHANLPAGSFIIASDEADDLQKQAAAFEVPLRAVEAGDDFPKRKLRSGRVAIYQPWIPWMYDEGWLRLVLDDFGFRYTVVHNADFRGKPNFNSRFDVLIFGSQDAARIVEGRSENADAPTYGDPVRHPNYSGGIGEDGVKAVKKFMQEGGTVLFFGEACELAIDKLNLPARNALKDVKRSDYFAPGSIFEIALDLSSPLTYGLPEKLAIYKNEPMVLKLRRYDREIRETGMFGNRDVLLSGWAVGEERLHGLVALAEIPVGQGKAILYAFRPQHRGQMYGTFKLIFNALYR